MNYKRILPIEVNYKLRHLAEWIRRDQPELPNGSFVEKKRVFFLDAPAYGNMGDQAIAYSMENMISKLLPNYIQIEVTEDRLPSNLKWLKKNVQDSDLICLTGGGNMGVTYQRYESVRRLIIKTFPNNPIVIFPQTFDYGDSAYEKKELRRAEIIYGKASRLVICARDEESYKRMKIHFPHAKVLYCPDIVLSLDFRNLITRRNRVGICLRDDLESVLNKVQRKTIYSEYPDHELLSTINSDRIIINHNNRQELVKKKLIEFGSKQLIITDRLHGMIFAYITGTPVVALPNSNGKVERVSRYLSSTGNVFFAKIINTVPMMEIKEAGTIQDRFLELEETIVDLVNY